MANLDKSKEDFEERCRNDGGKTNIIRMFGKQVNIVPRYGSIISGLFIGEKRLYEFSREDVLVIEVSCGIHAFVKREDISYIIVEDIGVVDSRKDSTKQFVLDYWCSDEK